MTRRVLLAVYTLLDDGFNSHLIFICASFSNVFYLPDRDLRYLDAPVKNRATVSQLRSKLDKKPM